MRNACVIGAGISGLVAAWRLEKAGIEVAVLETAPRAGGTVGTTREQGYLFESGPNSVLDTSPLVRRTLDDTGISSFRIDADSAARNRYVLRGGQLLPLPLSPQAFLATKLFSARAKLGLLREPFVPRSPANAEESVSQFVRRRLGGEFLDYAIDPFVAGVYAGDPELLALRAAFPRLHQLEQRYGSLIRGQILGVRERRANSEQSKQTAKMFSFRDGMQTLPDAIAARLSRLHVSTRATSIARNASGGWRITTESRAGPAALDADAVVLAVPAYEASGLVRSHAMAAAAALESIPYPPVAVVVSAHDRASVAHPLDGFGFLAPKRENRKVLGTIFSSSLFPNRAPNGAVLLTSYVGGMRQPELAQRDEAAISAAVHAEHAQLLGAPATPRWSNVRRWARAIPQYTLGHDTRVAALAGAEDALPGLYFCANYRGGISVADCIKSGYATADRIAAYLGA